MDVMETFNNFLSQPLYMQLPIIIGAMIVSSLTLLISQKKLKQLKQRGIMLKPIFVGLIIVLTIPVLLQLLID